MKSLTNRHHRRCRSNGGSSESSNISIVPADWHTEWHIIFGNKDAVAIARALQTHWLQRYWFIVRYNDTVTVIKDTCFDLVTYRQQTAWERLFAGKSVDRVLLEINSIWIDLEYLIKRRVGI